MPDIQVIKRNGEKEPLNLNKFHAVVARAVEGINGVSASQIELNSQIQFKQNIKTSDIQETLIKSAADLISEETPNYQYVAARLINYHLRKEVYGSFEPPHLFPHVNYLVAKGVYDKDMLYAYSLDEWDLINEMVDHRRDDLLTYAGMEQFRGKYLCRNRSTGEYHETPQMVYILIAATLFSQYPADTRLEFVRDFYDAISQHEISVSTPIMAGIRTPQRQFSSCVLIEIGDSLDSIIAASGVTKKYVSARAGIGLGSQLRSEGDEVKSGMVRHTGKIPYWKGFAADIGSCSQGGVRKGSGTMNEAIFDLEIENLLVLKNNKGTEETRIRQLDYCFHLNKLFYERYIRNENITLFSRKSSPQVFEAFYKNDPNFQEIYEKAERSHARKKTIPARELLETLARERFTTGRIYLMNIDHANSHGSFIPELAPIKMTNLCVEITLPTKELSDINDAEGEVALCTLLALNAGKIRSYEDFERLCRLAVRGLNCLMDYQDYQVPAAQAATMKRRPIGVGVMNFAYYLAKNGSNYSTPNLPLVHQFAESMMFHLIKASMEVAKQDPSRIPLKWTDTKYSQGILPIDTYKKEVDELTPNDLQHDWEWLRQQVLEYGMANSTVAAGMPGETSSQVLNATSSIDPPRGIISVKQSKDGILPQVVPESRKFKNAYEFLWDMPNCRGYLSIGAVFQKFFDQSLSLNTSYNPKNYPPDADGNYVVPMTEVIGDIFYAYKYGVKTLYYNNTAPVESHGDAPTDEQEQVVEQAEEICEGCSL